MIGGTGSHWLRRVVPVVMDPHVTNADFSLTNGDIDGDNEVAIGDYSLLSLSFGSGPGDANYIEEADLNGDEVVDIGDFSILSANFGDVGD
jgi:hypothetical protein